jgi:hypothetical protein
MLCPFRWSRGHRASALGLEFAVPGPGFGRILFAAGLTLLPVL